MIIEGFHERRIERLELLVSMLLNNVSLDDMSSDEIDALEGYCKAVDANTARIRRLTAILNDAASA